MTQRLSLDLFKYTCGPNETIREALRRIGMSMHLFQIIVSEDGQMLGTVTDGDIRRSLLQDISLDLPVTACMQISPVYGRVGQGPENIRKLHGLGSGRSFLPILDDLGKLVDILVPRDLNELKINSALVMAGGLGRRLGDKTKNTPKPMLEVAGQPILEHVLQKLESANIEEIYISVHYLSDQIKDFVDQRENLSSIRLLNEPEPRGTVGALSQLDPLTVGPTLIVNGDVITKVDFARLRDFHLRHGYDGTIGVAHHEIKIPYGVVDVDPEGLFRGIEEKPRIKNFVAAGLYCLSSEFIKLVPKDKSMDMPELLNLGRSAGLRIGLFPIHEYWIDVGNPNDLQTADADMNAS